MAQRMLAQWQQHSAEETIYIILCVHTGMSVWLKLNKREAARKKGMFFCLSIIVCGLFLTHKKASLLLFHIVVHAIPLPISFLYFLLACLTVPASLILILRGTLTTSLPLLFSFSLPGHQQHKVIYLLAKQQNKMPQSEKCIMSTIQKYTEIRVRLLCCYLSKCTIYEDKLIRRASEIK